jgi:NitT/TauT family transport system substrate-binding protein
VALRLLEGYLPNEKIKLVHYGSPQQRFEAMWNGEVDACVVMEPWIALGEKLGCKAVCEGHYLGAENASDDMDESTFAAINRAVAKAVDLLNADKRKYLHYLIDDPRHAAALAQYGGLTRKISTSRLRYRTPRRTPTRSWRTPALDGTLGLAQRHCLFRRRW